MITTEAQYPGVCGQCEGQTSPGETITSSTGGRWQHLACPPGRFDVVREICASCFTEKSITGNCLCEVTS